MQFNLMPLIDVVLLLIVFFMLICQFISRENFRLTVPDQCANALTPEQVNRDNVTVSVFYKNPPAEEAFSNSTIENKNQSIIFAIRNQQFDPQADLYLSEPDQFIDDLANQIATQARLKGKSLVYLRADKDVPYGQVQKSLIALSKARIEKVQLAALRSGTPRQLHVESDTR